MKVLVANCTLTQIQQPAYTDHLNLIYAMARKHPDIEFMQMNGKRMSIDRFRNKAVEICMQYDIDYLFFIDDDMQMPGDTFTKLYQANYDILAAFNYIRGYPFKIMSFKYDLLCKTKRLKNVTERDLPDPLGSVIPVDAIGTAVCLIKTEIFKKVPPPYFLTGPHGTEDIYMCLKVKDFRPETTIGMHTGVQTGHLLDPEVISHGTRASLMQYFESFMSPEDIQKARSEEPEITQVPKIRFRGYLDQLSYEELMAQEMDNKL